MSYGAGIVGKVFELMSAMPSWFWWAFLGFMVLYLIVWIWNRIWLKIGPDAKPIFAVVTYAVIAGIAAGLSAWLIFRG